MNKLLKNEYLAVRDVAEYLDISVSKVYQLTRQPDFPICRLDGVIRIPRDAFLFWLAQRTCATSGNGGNE